MSFIYDATHEYEHFVIDVERNIKLPCPGLGCEGHFEARMFWHDQEIEIDYNSFPAERKENEKGEVISESRYSVWRIQIPDGFPEDKETVIQAVKDALLEVYTSDPITGKEHVKIDVDLSHLHD